MLEEVVVILEDLVASSATRRTMSNAMLQEVLPLLLHEADLHQEAERQRDGLLQQKKSMWFLVCENF